VHAALVIAQKDLRQRVRDRSALVLGFIAPLAIAAIMSVAFSGTNSFHTKLAVVDDDRGALANGLDAAFHGGELSHVASVRDMATDADARSAVKAGSVQAALFIPAGFSAAALGTGPVPPLEVLANPDNQVSANLAQAVAEEFVAQLDADRLAVGTALASGATGTASALTRLASHLQLPVRLVDRPTGAHPLTAISYFAPAMAMFFLFFAVGFGARGFAAERRDGTLDRLAAAPLTPATILAGKALSVVVYGLASMTAMWVATTALFGARWGNPVAVGLVICAIVLSVVAMAALVITWAKTDRQVDSLSSIVAFGLSILGGNFFFISAAPALMRRLALFTPNGWALRGFVDLATTSGGPGTVAIPLGAILVFTGCVAVLAAVRSRAVIIR